MATKDYGQTVYPLNSASFNTAADMEQLAESLEGRTVVSFASTSARDTALASLTSDQKKGVVAHVQGTGWFGYDGSAWRQFSTTLVKGGFITTAVEGNGFARVPSADCFFNGAAPTAIFATATYRYDVVSFALYDGGGALFKFYNSSLNTETGPGVTVTFSWLAIKVT